MHWEKSERRQAIIDWQDRYVVAVWGAMNEAAISSLAAFDAAVPEAGWRGSWLERARFTAANLDPRMRLTVTGKLRPMLKRARQELISIDECLTPVAAGLRRYCGTAMPEGRPAPETAGSGRPAGDRPGSPVPTTDSSWWGLIGNIASGVQTAGEAVSSSVRSMTGVHGGLRQHARSHVERYWLSDHQADDEVASVLAQLEAAIRRVALQARSLGE